MSVSRNEFLDIISVVNYLAHADGEMHANEKKVLMGVFKTLEVTKEEQKVIRSKSSLADMLSEIKSKDAKNTLIDVLALVAGADGMFEDKEEIFIRKIMKRLGLKPEEHTYFKDGGKLDIKLVRSNFKTIMNSLKDLSK